jgi:hypothetical protein
LYIYIEKVFWRPKDIILSKYLQTLSFICDSPYIEQKIGLNGILESP